MDSHRFWQQVNRVGARIHKASPSAGARLMFAAHTRIGEPEVNWIGQFVDPGRTSIDVGANWGFYTRALLKRSRVISFEPNPTVAMRLQLAFPKAQVIQCALGDHEAVATLRMPLMDNGQPSTGRGTITDHELPSERETTLQVPVKTLDSFDLRGIGFIKIDADYHESAVLTGGWETIRRERPAMMIEIEDDLPPIIAARLAAIGYSCRFLCNGALHPIEDWHRGLNTWHGAAPNNFFFVPG